MDDAPLIEKATAEDALKSALKATTVVSGALVCDILVGDLDALTEGFAFLEDLGYILWWLSTISSTRGLASRSCGPAR